MESRTVRERREDRQGNTHFRVLFLLTPLYMRSFVQLTAPTGLYRASEKRTKKSLRGDMCDAKVIWSRPVARLYLYRPFTKIRGMGVENFGAKLFFFRQSGFSNTVSKLLPDLDWIQLKILRGANSPKTTLFQAGHTKMLDFQKTTFGKCPLFKKTPYLKKNPLFS